MIKAARSWPQQWCSRFIPKASCVERLSSLQTSSQIFKVISKLLVLSKLHHIVEVLHMLDNCIQLENTEVRVTERNTSKIKYFQQILHLYYCLQLYSFRIGEYLLVLFAAFEYSDCVLVGIGGNIDTLCDLGWRRRSLENPIILLGVGGLLTGSSCRNWWLKKRREIWCEKKYVFDDVYRPTTGTSTLFCH